MDDPLYERLLDFLEDQLGQPREAFEPYLDMSQDLGVAGDDGAVLIEKFAEVFSVDIRAFNFDDFFFPEGIDIFWFLRRQHKKRLTVGDLYHAGKTKVWPTETGRSSLDDEGQSTGQ
jgi:hypothetical protein